MGLTKLSGILKCLVQLPKSTEFKCFTTTMTYEFETIDGEYALDIIYQSIPSELLQTQIDTCWVHVAGEDPAEYIRKYRR
jgi:hypothetical protein